MTIIPITITIMITGGVRPFGVSSMIAGFSETGPQLYLTDPAGTFSAWKANCIGGRNEKAVRELLEKEWKADMDEDSSVKLSLKALLEVVDGGSKNMEVMVMIEGGKSSYINEERLQEFITTIEKENEESRAASASKE